jgi:uncharacterized integral membrane protein
MEESLRSKTLYKIELYLLKVIPITLALIHLLNTILSYFNIDLILFSYLGGVSLLPLIFLYISSYVFKFCEYHRMFLHYIVVNNSITLYDYYIGIPIKDLSLLILHLILAGIFLFIILYCHVRHNKKTFIHNNK